MSILIGTSGFSYDDWKGHFYPRSLKRDQMLSYYARYFPAVELNTTYYGIPKAQTVSEMTRRVPPGFRFVVKAHQDMTHNHVFQPQSFARFREAIQPLQDAGMLGCILAQFPFGFHRTPDNEKYLPVLRRELAEVPVVVEFRNVAWVEAETFTRLRDLGLGYCCVDEPRLKGLIPPVTEATSSIGYVRFRGRNAEKWWKHQQAYERYDYSYSTAELNEWTPRVEALAAQTETTYLFFNNHYHGQAGRNAQEMAQLLGQPLPDLQPPQGTLVLEESSL